MAETMTGVVSALSLSTISQSGHLKRVSSTLPSLIDEGPNSLALLGLSQSGLLTSTLPAKDFEDWTRPYVRQCMTSNVSFPYYAPLFSPRVPPTLLSNNPLVVLWGSFISSLGLHRQARFEE